MPAMDVTSYRGDPIQESMMQLCPFWTCNIVRFGLATLYIYILQQTSIYATCGLFAIRHNHYAQQLFLKIVAGNEVSELF